MCYTANAVANFFIEKGVENNKPLTHLQIQKMVYFAHAVYFKKHKKPLIVNPVFAWKYGPVIQDLYSELKDYGDSPIKEKIKDIKITADGSDAVIWTPSINPKDTDVIDYLTRAYNSLGSMTGGRLCGISHAEGGAWYKTLTNRKLNPDAKDLEIPRNLVILDDVIMACGR